MSISEGKQGKFLEIRLSRGGEVRFWGRGLVARGEGEVK